MKKRLLSFVLALCMMIPVFSVFPNHVMAADTEILTERDDGVWYFPLDWNSNWDHFSDWAGCNGYNPCPFHGIVHYGDDSHNNEPLGENNQNMGHNGIDIWTSGQPAVYAAADGIVYTSGENFAGRGILVVIEHEIGTDENGVSWSYYSFYQHLSSAVASLDNGENGREITPAGTVIGYAGSTGGNYGEHLHFGILMGKSGHGYEMSRYPDGSGYSLGYLQGKRWILDEEPFYQEGRILNNPSVEQEYIPLINGTNSLRDHPGSVLYTNDLTKVAIQPKSSISSTSRDVVLAIDVSSSMQGDRFDNLKTAAKSFITQLLESSSNTRIGIVTYSGTVRDTIAFISDEKALTSFIDKMSLSWTGTNIYAGIDQARIYLENSNAANKDLVIMTDGEANKGVTGVSATILVDDYDANGNQKEIYLSDYGAAIYARSQDIKNEGIMLYTLGFSLTQDSVAYNLMHYIPSRGPAGDWYFWNITNDNIDDVMFTFDDIVGTIQKKDKIVISIHCPVEASVSYEEEVLDRDNLITSFGRVTISEVDDGYEYLFTMDDLTDYEINIQGTGEGTMDFKLTYVKETETHYREFLNVPITADTKITTTATDSASDFSLYVDSDGDGEDDERWTAGIDETVTEMTEDLTEDSSLYWSLLLLLGGVNDGSNIPMEQIFTDIQKTDWFYKETAFVYANGLMQGTSATTFAPNATLTRAMLVQVLFNLEGKPAVDASSGFADVAAGAWYFDAVSWAAENGIVTGYAADRFGPEDAVTREQTAAIFQRYAAYRGLDTSASGSLSQFADAAAVSAYAQHAVAWAVDTGLLSGKGSGKLDPAGTATRAEIAAILMRFCENVLK